ncbi:MAG: SRPBCC family protein [Actinobacteria bacterium]|nr:SRPBCC family protein [Actinomycetota bacterium]
MRYRDCPTVEVVERIATSPDAAWAAVCDISLPTRCGGELQFARWLDDATTPTVGARFEGVNRNEHLGEWTTTSTVVEVEPGRRWVWEVSEPTSLPWSQWGFEVDPLREGVVIRQWARIGPGRSGLNRAIDAMPEREGRIVEVRLAELAEAMRGNLDRLRSELE